jgi:Flp pilus assembly protein protease CpaA
MTYAILAIASAIILLIGVWDGAQRRIPNHLIGVLVVLAALHGLSTGWVLPVTGAGLALIIGGVFGRARISSPGDIKLGIALGALVGPVALVAIGGGSVLAWALRGRYGTERGAPGGLLIGICAVPVLWVTALP